MAEPVLSQRTVVLHLQPCVSDPMWAVAYSELRDGNWVAHTNFQALIDELQKLKEKQEAYAHCEGADPL